MVTYPLSITLMHRLGDDGTYLCQDLSFADAEEIHRWLGRILRDRTAYAKAVKAAKGRRQGA